MAIVRRGAQEALRPADAPVPPQVSTLPTPGPAPAPISLGPSMGLTPALSSAQAGMSGGIVQDPDGRGFTNPGGGHDWNVGYGPGGNWQGQDQKTGKAIVGTDPGSGDALGIPRGTQPYRDATAAHKAWIQSNLNAGLTLADLGLTPTKGGGLSDFMEMGSQLFAGQTPATTPTPTRALPGSGTFSPTKTVADPNLGNSTAPGGNITGPTIPAVAPGPITPTLGTGLLGVDKTTANPNAGNTPVTNSSSAPFASGAIGAPQSIPGVTPAASAPRRMVTGPNNSLSASFGNSMGLGLGAGSLYGSGSTGSQYGQRRLY